MTCWLTYVHIAVFAVFLGGGGGGGVGGGVRMINIQGRGLYFDNFLKNMLKTDMR